MVAMPPMANQCITATLDGSPALAIPDEVELVYSPLCYPQVPCDPIDLTLCHSTTAL